MSSSVFRFSIFFNSSFSTPNLYSDHFAFFESVLFNSDRSVFSTPNLCFSSSNLRFSYCIFQIVSSSSFGSVCSVLQTIFIFTFVLQILLESKKLEFHVNKLLHLSNKTRVFEAWFCHRTRVSKTRYASFLNDFKTLLTNDILSPYYASLQISPIYRGKVFSQSTYSI